ANASGVDISYLNSDIDNVNYEINNVRSEAANLSSADGRYASASQRFGGSARQHSQTQSGHYSESCEPLRRSRTSCNSKKINRRVLHVEHRCGRVRPSAVIVVSESTVWGRPKRRMCLTTTEFLRGGGLGFGSHSSPLHCYRQPRSLSAALSSARNGMHAAATAQI